MAEKVSDIAEKWGRDVAERGFSQIPNYLLLLNQFLDQDHKLSPVELLVLLQLVGTWWRKDAMPFPSMSTLAVRCGVSDRQIQRAINQLVKVGLLRRINRRKQGIIASNAYDLAPLVAILGDVAKAFPNEFVRNVDKALVKEISRKLDSAAAATAPGSEPAAAESAEAPAG
jgi:predicted transcriptional regulator